MKLLRSFPFLSFLLTLVSLVAFALAVRSVGLLLVSGVLAGMSWSITEGPRGRALPRWTSNILIIAASLNVFVDIANNPGDVLAVLGRFVVWMSLIKLYERKSPKDYSQLLALGFLLMATGCIISTDLVFGVLLLVYAVLGLHVLLLYQLHAAYELNRTERSRAIPPGYRLVPPLRPIIGRRCGLQFRVLGGCIGLAGLGLSIIVFLAVPRHLSLGGGPWLDAAPPRTGLSDEVNLVSGTRITDSRRRVMTVQVTDDRGRPVRVAERFLYLRGTVQDEYRGSGLWKPAERRRTTLAAIDIDPERFAPLSDRPIPDEPGPAGGRMTQRFELFTDHRAVFSIHAPVSVRTPDPRTMTYDPAAQTLSYTGPGSLFEYEVEALTRPSEAALQHLMHGHGGAAGAAAGRRFDFTFHDARVETLARSILADHRLPRFRPPDGEARWEWNRRAAGAFTAYLESAPFRYTLDLSDVVDAGEGVDPIVRFLFDTRRGHCEYFAAAHVALCQSVRIEARLVTGYVGVEYDEAAQRYTVLESNAHAWTEVRTGPWTWTTCDPTPPGVLREGEAASGLADRLRSLYDRLEFHWNTGVVSFDTLTQQRLAERVDAGWSRRIERAVAGTREWLAEVNRLFYFGPAGYIWMGIVGAALALAVIALIKLMRRFRQVRRRTHLEHFHGSEYQRLVLHLGFYLDMLAVLSQRGAAKPGWQPPRDFAAALAATHHTAGELVREVTDLFYAARYGGRRLSADDRRRARELVHELARVLRRPETPSVRP
jgi:transglutaminase-like putative cysteine protease